MCRQVPFSDLLEKIVQSLSALPEVRCDVNVNAFRGLPYVIGFVFQSYHFRKPVQAKVVPDYYAVIKFPMDLQTMKEV